jgi:hypothetical protein
MIIAIDFDGTLNSCKWPGLGEPQTHAIEVMKKLKKDGHFLIIWTCREGDFQTEVKNWLLSYEIPFDTINENEPEGVKKYNNDCRKISANVYIDDRNLGGLPTWNEIYDIISGKIKPFWFYKLIQL